MILEFVCSSLFCCINIVVMTFIVNNFKMLSVIISSKLLLPYYLTCFSLRREWSCILYICVCTHTHTHTHSHTLFDWLSSYLCSLFFNFYPHIGQYRLLSRVPFAMQQVFIIVILYNIVNHSLPIYLSPPSLPLITISLFSTSVPLFLFYK